MRQCPIKWKCIAFYNDTHTHTHTQTETEITSSLAQ